MEEQRQRQEEEARRTQAGSTTEGTPSITPPVKEGTVLGTLIYFIVIIL